jgi:drug/metabolite transporter (DMT)-like permease
MLFAALALLPFYLMERRAARADGRVTALSFAPVLLAGLFFAIDIGFFHTSLTMTSVAHATLIVNLAPLVALAAGFLLFGERFGGLKIAGLVLSLGGALAMTSGRAEVAGTLEGNALAFAGMFGYAAYLIALKFARRDASTLAVMTLSSAASAVLLLGAAAISGETFWPQSVSAWAIVALLGLVVHALGQGLVTIGMRETPVGLASILLLVQPVGATVCAWFMFGEVLSPLELAGAIAVLVGIGMATRARN